MSPGRPRSSPRIVVRPLRDVKEFDHCEHVQEAVWGSAGVSGELLLVTQRNGGLVLGAFAGQRLVGFLYAFLARRRGRLIHWSHLMAVEPDFRDRGLGFRMKLEHRRLALGQGIRSIAWTYDPLQSRNAALNIHRLGAQVDEYLPDCYGRFPSLIERGLPSDRFVAEWHITSRRVEERLARWHECEDGRSQAMAAPTVAAPIVNEVVRDRRGLAVNRRLRLRLGEPRLLVEIPTDTDRMRALDIKLAARWRLEMRRAFQHYFRNGYHVDDFLPPAETGGHRAFYLLARRSRGSSR